MLGEKENYKYSGILEADSIKQAVMKEKSENSTSNEGENFSKARNLIKVINSWIVHLVRYSRLFSKWTREKFREMNQRTRNLITMHKALHWRDDKTDSMYQEKKEKEVSPASRTTSYSPGQILVCTYTIW